MIVTFHNVTIRVQADSAEEAYEKLDAFLSSEESPVRTYESDTYTESNGKGGSTEPRDVEELF